MICVVQIFITLLIVLTSFVSSTVTAETNSLRDVLHSASPMHLQKVLRRSDDLRSSRVACNVQLRAHRIPTACFHVLKVETAADQISPSEARSQLAFLERICLERGRTEISMETLNRALSEVDVSTTCGSALTERLADLRYQIEEGAPEQLFDQRFSRQILHSERESGKQRELSGGPDIE